MSRRAKQQQPPAAAVGSSRRTRRAEVLPRAPAGLSEGPNIVSNPIFSCEAGPRQPNNRPPGDQLRCVYRPGSLYALVHDPAAATASPETSIGIGKAPPPPLPLPPCRAHPSSGRVGPAHAVGGPHGRVLRRATHDPFMAAYVACSKSAAAGGRGGAEAVDRPQHKKKQERRRKKKKEKEAAGRKRKGRKVIFRGCGIWRSGWAAGAKYAGAMSCMYGCAVAAGQKEDASPTGTKAEDDAPAGPTLDLSWTPAVLSARALDRREQR